MFGYVIADRQQMSDKEKGEYRSYYCGLCKEIQRIAGLRGSAVLSYDCTFLYLLHSGLYEPENTVSMEKCSVHPFRKHRILRNQIADYAASMNILLGMEMTVHSLIVSFVEAISLCSESISYSPMMFGAAIFAKL